MGCSDSRISDDEAGLIPPTNPESEAKNPVVFANNANPVPPKLSRSELIPDLHVFSEIDDHARSVPSSLRLTPPSLVNYLVKPCQRDLDVIRVFYVWICSNISYDVNSYFGKKTPRNDPQSVLDIKLAVCQGYSELFSLLCRMVKIPVKVIEGHSKGFAYNPNKPLTAETVTNHAWNAVYAQGEWRFIECTWGAGIMNEDGVFERKYSDRHFLTDPDKMINAHFPLFDNVEEQSAAWQLLKDPISLEDFNDRVKLYEAAQDWQIDLHPYKNVQIETKDKVEIMVRTKVVPLVDVGAHMYDREGNNCDKYLMVQRLPNDVFKLTVRPQASKKYKCTIFGRISPRDNGVYANLVDYMVQGFEIQENVQPYPEQFGAWGVDSPTKVGIDNSMKYRTYFVCDSGRMSLPIKTVGENKFTHKLFHAEKVIEDAEDFVIREFQRNLMVMHMRFPIRGFYTLKLYTKPNSTDQKMFIHATNILVECKKAADIGPFPKTYGETDKQDCILLEPGEKDVPANSSVTFTIESPLLKCAMIKSTVGSTKMTPNNTNQWSETVTTPGPGENIGIYGSENSGRYLALYQFRSEKEAPPSTRAKIDSPKFDEYSYINKEDSNLSTL